MSTKGVDFQSFRFNNFNMYSERIQVEKNKGGIMVLQSKVLIIEFIDIDGTIDQMLQPEHKTYYRISQNRKKMSQSETSKGVVVHVQSPVLQQYNSIDLDKTSKYHRIKHKFIDNERHLPKNDPIIKADKWVTVLDRYMQNKSKIQQKKGLTHTQFQFQKLDKTNRLRYIRLTANEALPIDMKRVTIIADQFDRGSLEKQQNSRYRIKTDQSAHKSLMDVDDLVMSSNKELARLRRLQQNPVNDKIFHYFIEGYFKKKYRRVIKQSNAKKKQVNRKHLNYEFLIRNNTD